MSHGDIWSWEGGVSGKKKMKTVSANTQAVPSWHVQGTVKSQVWLDWTDKWEAGESGVCGYIMEAMRKTCH